MKNKFFFIVIFYCFFISGCTINDFNKKNLAELSASATGGYLGYHFADGDLFSTTVGSTAGLVLGKYLSDFIGQNDQYYYRQEAIRVLEMNSNQITGYWKNPKTGNEGLIKIKGYYGDPECRLIEHIFIDKDEPSNVYDTACREEGGQWAMIK